jgi:hypothetical protein
VDITSRRRQNGDFVRAPFRLAFKVALMKRSLAMANLSRRELLRAGGVSLLGVSLPQLLRAEESSDQKPAAKSCIFLALAGGLSHLDTIDPKPDAPAEVRGAYSTIPTSIPGVCFTEPLARLASLAHRFCLLRSMSHTEVPHITATHMLLTGQSSGARTDDTPVIGSLVSKLRPADVNLPSHIWLHNMKTGTNKVPRYNSGLSKIGYEHAAMRVGYELNNPAAPDFRVHEFDPADGLTSERMDRRLRLLDQLAAQEDGFAGGEAGNQFLRFQQKARELITGPDARQAFDLAREPDAIRDRYGRNPLGQYLLMSRRLIEAGVRLVTVTGWPGLPEGETVPQTVQVWDMHDAYYKGSDTMYGNGPYGCAWSLPRLDQALATLVEDLAERGLLDETLIVVATEFGRTAKFEGKGRGRGHWPNCFSIMLAGGGVRGGMVYGASDRHGAFVADGRPLRFEDFGATILYALGIAPETRYGPDRFSFRASAGVPLHEVFG